MPLEAVDLRYCRRFDVSFLPENIAKPRPFGIEGRVLFEGRVRIQHEGGQRVMRGNRVSIEGADTVTLLIAAATNFKRYDDISANRPAIDRSSSCQRPPACGVDVSIRALSSVREQPSGWPAGQFAGTLEREHESMVGMQVHDQYQHSDELLACGNDRAAGVYRAFGADGR